MNPSGVPEGLGIIGQPQDGQAELDAKVCVGNAFDVHESVMPFVEPAAAAAVSDVWGGKNQAP
jgi:hypothetical protein